MRLAFHGPRFEHDAAHVQGVAGAYRLDPADVLQAGRAEAGGVEQVGVAHHAHGQRTGMPAAGAEAAEQAVLAGFLGEVEGLRVELAGEVHDLLGADGDPPNSMTLPTGKSSQ
jgi:hypothetical protein